MDETRRFLRYVTPGLIFLAETLVLLFILLPDWMLEQVSALKDKEAIGLVFATLLASGSVGFIFSVIHHFYAWRDPPAIDHRPFIARLRGSLIRLVDASTGEELAEEVAGGQVVKGRVGLADAWVITTSLWHERLEKSELVKAADTKTGVLTDMVHTTGTALVATWVGWLTAVVIASFAVVSGQALPPWRLAFASAIACVLLFVHHRNHRHMTFLTQRLIEEVLHDALVAEKEALGKEALVAEEARPIETRVFLGEAPWAVPRWQAVLAVLAPLLLFILVLHRADTHRSQSAPMPELGHRSL